MAVDRGTAGQLFWNSEGMYGFTEEASVSFPLTADGQAHAYRLNVADDPRWRGVIRQLRLDPTDAGGANVAVDYIRGG